ncbi:CLUMA_CG010180, isoform A [Clunio marinus]|uniref:CLUMA_CG010180, isoform A n=1 Tax=Clunio marinus TaxID=568069 RepID=A0A1J1I8G0_9DIPT|nr:CLUMA_CG010180, isoform A [Clunio marinus]
MSEGVKLKLRHLMISNAAQPENQHKTSDMKNNGSNNDSNSKCKGRSSCRATLFVREMSIELNVLLMRFKA